MNVIEWFKNKTGFRFTRDRVRDGVPVVSIWNQFRPSPWGGANQFMLALKGEWLRQGIEVRVNEGGRNVSVYILSARQFDVSTFRKKRDTQPLPVLHRLDGPVSLYRTDGSGKELDDFCFALNAEFASVTVFQSKWSLEHNLALDYKPINPVVIRNASDPEIFHARGHTPFSQSRRIRLISTSWSSNPGKGANIYKWIDEHVDWDRFEYTFVGNSPVRFSRILHIAPVPSSELAGLLRQHDVFIIASQNDPCSNSLIEALTCGLPALFLNSGGHPELVGEGGLPFNDVDEILPRLDRLVAGYEQYQSRIVVPRIKDVAQRYLQVAGINVNRYLCTSQ